VSRRVESQNVNHNYIVFYLSQYEKKPGIIKQCSFHNTPIEFYVKICQMWPQYSLSKKKCKFPPKSNFRFFGMLYMKKLANLEFLNIVRHNIIRNMYEKEEYSKKNRLKMPKIQHFSDFRIFFTKWLKINAKLDQFSTHFLHWKLNVS
jgi:hypothetical protein